MYVSDICFCAVARVRLKVEPAVRFLPRLFDVGYIWGGFG